MRKLIFLSLAVCLLLAGCSAGESAPTTAPAVTEPPVIATAPPATEAPTEAPAEAPTETTTPPPEPEEFLLSFVGDCCLANLKTWSTGSYFIGTVGSNYDYPFANVLDYFAQDDCTFINLENPLTDRGSPANKSFVFRGPPAYTEILTRGSVEFANVANNHSMDYGKVGFQDTLDALDSAGIHYAPHGTSTIFTTERGLTIGVYAQTYPLEADAIPGAIAQLREAGAELVIACFHWGKEYYYKPNETQVEIGRAAIDAGANIVYGHHSHVLQSVEEYNGGIIYYSLGNFCFGGNTNPDDKDSAILQQVVIRDPDGTLRLGELISIPCSISSVDYTNNFQPTPLDPDTEAYHRILAKLDGTYDKSKIHVDYRPELG